MVTYTRTLELTKDPIIGTSDPILLRRGEHGLTEITGRLMQDGKAFDASGYSATFRAYNGAGKWVIAPATVNKETVTYKVDSNLTAAEGDTKLAYFELTKDGGVLDTISIPIHVLDSVVLTDQEAEGYQNAIDALMTEVREGIDAAIKEMGENAKSTVDKVMETFDTVTGSEVAYATGNSATQIPSSGWSPNPIAVAQGKFLWTRTTTHYKKQPDTVSYTPTYQGRDGEFAGEERVSALEAAWDSVNHYLSLTTRWHGSTGEVTRITEENPDIPNLTNYLNTYDCSTGAHNGKDELRIYTNPEGTAAKFFGYARFNVVTKPTMGNGVFFVLQTDFKIPNWSGMSINLAYADSIIPETTAARPTAGRAWASVTIGQSGTVYFCAFIPYRGLETEVQSYNVCWNPVTRFLRSPNGAFVGA